MEETLQHIQHHRMTVVAGMPLSDFDELVSILKETNKVIVLGPSNGNGRVPYLEGIRLLKNPPDLFVLEHTSSPLYENDLGVFLTLWKMEKSCRLFISGQSPVRGSLTFPKYDSSRFYENALCEMEDLEKHVVAKVEEVKLAYPEGTILVISPSSNRWNLSEGRVVEGTDATALYTEAVAIVDTCVRNVCYSSVGGGVRYVEDYVTGEFLDPVKVYGVANDIPVYFMLPHDIMKKPYGRFEPYWGDIYHEVIDAGFSTKQFFPLRYVEPGHSSVIRALGFMTNSFLPASNPKVSQMVFAAAFDSLSTHVFNGLEASSFQVRFDPERIEMFSRYRGEDSAEVYANIWNHFVRSKEEFETWVDASHLNFPLMMEFWNTLQAIAKFYKKKIRKSEITPKDINACRQSFRELGRMYERKEKSLYGDVFYNTEYDDANVTLFQNPMYTGEPFSITPVTVQREFQNILSFVLIR